MEVITSYLENLFLSLPKTEEVLRAKKELAHMMEDKYNELLQEGKKQNEAIGIVISEFGDLEELAEELGLEELYREKRMRQDDFVKEERDKSVRVIDRNMAKEYISVSGSVSKWIAAGVMLCIYCPIFILICGGIDLQFKRLSDLSYVIMGLIPLFVMIAAAVFIFICSGSKIERYEYLKKEVFVLDEAVEKMLAEMEERERPRFAVIISVGVALCILSVIPFLIVSSSGWGDGYISFSVVYLLLLVGIGVACFIIGGNKMECIKVLRQEEEYTIDRKKSRKLIDIIAGIYWPVVVAVYFIWSFTTARWGKTWIIWPAAGILFGAVAVLCEGIEKIRKNAS